MHTMKGSNTNVFDELCVFVLDSFLIVTYLPEKYWPALISVQKHDLKYFLSIAIKGLSYFFIHFQISRLLFQDLDQN